MRTQSKYRVLVVRLSAMGDILHALPAVTALRQAHPNWTIDWVVEPKWSALLAAADSTARDTEADKPRQPLVDNLHFAPTKAWRKHPLSSSTRTELVALRKALRAGQYDTAIDLQGAVRSAVVARMAGARRLIGESNPRERAARLLFNERVTTAGAHVMERGVELVNAIAGDLLQPVQPMLPVDSAAEAVADQLLAPAGSAPLVLMNPGAGWGAKRWPVERYAAVARGLTERGMRVVVNAGPGEALLAETIVKETDGSAIVLAGDVSLLIAVTRRVALTVAGDTGPLHLACALGKPVVGIFGPTDPSRNGPFLTRYIVLRSPESRRDHTRRAEPEAGLLTIEPEAVLQAAEALLYPETTP